MMTGERRLSGVPRDSGLESREKLRDINRSLEDRCDGVAHWRQIYSPSSRKKIPPLPFARFTEKFRWPLVIDYPIRTAQKKSSRDIKEKKTNKDISNRRKRKKGKKNNNKYRSIQDRRCCPTEGYIQHFQRKLSSAILYELYRDLFPRIFVCTLYFLWVLLF